jgi:hypothetical protein
MPEWTIVSTIVLPPKVEVPGPVLVVPAFNPEWMIVSTIDLPPKVEVLVLVWAFPACIQNG